ncbi:methyltransferase [Rhodotorula toruloides]|uniref:mRNA m(6)A methyltransferase n=1 Tax=Rhodotorula toruloides (strain NP11) TaxID=1130832 RepID=M7XIK6_RHOT1|nr:mRNA (2'-O-methyladenosine-N6-)-methyltransferase [Rhodotorula toruloides NP11]EMS20003.1 mRNA (2'-O-methyladenosine-N6-)-methyltransferase [Rhodotorula toruloides NP11]KAJ8292382.1 N6-adenosine-methyltransferase subunit METTL3 [Rhodotorula toruloides]
MDPVAVARPAAVREMTEPSSSSSKRDGDYARRLSQAKALRKAFPLSRPFVDICSSTTREACPRGTSCLSVHFVRSLRPHTEVSLGDCSYLNTCHRMATCRYVHWVLEDPDLAPKKVAEPKGWAEEDDDPVLQPQEVLPPQWINADLRELDVSVLGKYDVVVADPPWAIHQEARYTLPYGTLTDDEMMRMPVGAMQDEGGLLFLWVTGRAMELGRECLKAWGYERIDELVWVKTNQLQGLIRTGRTGHWLNHSKEHCLVAIRRPASSTAPPRLPSWFNRGLDTQVLLAEVRETSRKPDELYDMIERILGGKGKGRKVELFGREHNLRDGWWTLGNQLGDRDQVFEPDVVANFADSYPHRNLPLLDPKTLKPIAGKEAAIS